MNLMNQLSGFLLVYCTTQSKQAATTLASKLLSNSLAACISVIPIDSSYSWKGENFLNQPEHQLMIKTHKQRWEQVRRLLKEDHGEYECPEVISVEVWGVEESYGRWMLEAMKISDNNSDKETLSKDSGDLSAGL